MKSLVAGVVLFSACLSAQLPTPESHFGHPIGVDRELLDWDKVVSYFEALAKTSDKIRFEELGKTAEGRPFIAATISSAATLRNLDHYRDIQAKLADPRRTTPAAAARLITEGKTVVLITCSIHSTEVASTHSAIQFAYNLLTQDTPKFRAILDNVIIVLVPSQNPDGLDIVTRWYRKTLGTPYEGTSPPELWHKYVGHDNNRDWYIFSQPETQLTVSKPLPKPPMARCSAAVNSDSLTGFTTYTWTPRRLLSAASECRLEEPSIITITGGCGNLRARRATSNSSSTPCRRKWCISNKLQF
jgi:Zinc carboxypeptidase